MKKFKNLRGAKLFLNKILLQAFFKNFLYIIFTNSNIKLDKKFSDKFESLFLPGSVFRHVLPTNLNQLVFGSLYVVGTNSLDEFNSYINESKNLTLLIRFTLENKVYILNTFDYKRFNSTEFYDSNLYSYINIY